MSRGAAATGLAALLAVTAAAQEPPRPDPGFAPIGAGEPGLSFTSSRSSAWA